MLRPSGRSPMVTTSAPAACRIAGARRYAAPLAVSSTTRSPSSRCGTVESRWSAYRCPSDGSWRTRPTAAPTGRSHASRRRFSIASSSSSASLCPPRARNFSPLSGIGLWLAEMTAPRSAPRSAVRNATAGVGITPASTTSTPALASPATTAAVRNSPDARGSRPTTATGRCPSKAPTSPSTCAAATDRSRASSAVRSRLARPRTPSVPKTRPTRPPTISACCTGAPCGPSSGRTSCAPWPAGHG